jgi:hypothetical protein
MDDTRFDAFNRSLTNLRSRRGTLGALLGGTLGLLGLSETTAKKKKKKPAQACAAACKTTCSTCYARAAGGTLCGGVGSADCATPCSSDNDCVGTIRPFCTKSFTERATGQTSTWGCAAACTSMAACPP